MSRALATMDSPLTDGYGRRMRKLRISLLDACNMRCRYCMPDAPHFLPQKDWASADELLRIAGNLVALGIEEVRLTGGEPTLRADLLPIVRRLSTLPVKLGLTSNGLLLDGLLDELAKTRCRHLNISLDSLDTANFARITGRDVQPRVEGALRRARGMGFSLKVNAVMLRGLNDHELLDFVAWSGETGIAVRFLEVMRIGVMREGWRERFIPAAEMLARLRAHHVLTPRTDAADATAYTFMADNGADVGFIASESEPFCGSCSRLRLSPQGVLRACLFKEGGVNVKSLSPADYPAALRAVLEEKPAGRLAQVAQPMYQIGG